MVRGREGCYGEAACGRGVGPAVSRASRAQSRGPDRSRRG